MEGDFISIFDRAYEKLEGISHNFALIFGVWSRQACQGLQGIAQSHFKIENSKVAINLSVDFTNCMEVDQKDSKKCSISGLCPTSSDQIITLIW